MKININELKIKYIADLKNAEYDLKRNKNYFKNKQLSDLPPIEVDNNYYIENGHHRYLYAKFEKEDIVNIILV